MNLKSIALMESGTDERRRPGLAWKVEVGCKYEGAGVERVCGTRA